MDVNFKVIIHPFLAFYLCFFILGNFLILNHSDLMNRRFHRSWIHPHPLQNLNHHFHRHHHQLILEQP